MASKTDTQQITKAKGRPMLTWVGKKPLEKVEWYPAQEKEVYGLKSATDFNKLFWGDNLQVLSHLLKDYRGKIDLIYIDPPFDSKADYIKKVKLRGQEIEGQQQGLLEEKQYADIWENDEYLQFMYERILIMRELLTENGSFVLHCDWHKNHHLRLLLDEIFGAENIVNEIIWYYWNKFQMRNMGAYARNHDTILVYAKSKDKHKFYPQAVMLDRPKKLKRIYWDAEKGRIQNVKDEAGKVIYDEVSDEKVDDVWDIPYAGTTAHERTNYPTQKPEELLNRIIKTYTDEGDWVMDTFLGSGTTVAVAQKLGRKWIGCDINIGAIQTTTKRLAQIIEEQQKEKIEDFKGLLAFKVFNVNDYDIFKNEIEAKEIVMEMYGIEPVKRSQFDGVLDNKFVKIMPLNKVLNKLDIKTVLKNIGDTIDSFTPKTTTTGSEEIYEEGVIIICSGAELDASDFLKKENKTGVKVEIRDILNDKKTLIFKKKPEARVEVKAHDRELSVAIQEFYSPILMRKLELENEKIIDKKEEAKVEDFRQIIDSVAIDVDYDGKLFNAEIIDLPSKKELIEAEYKHTYDKSGKYTVAVKIVDVLGEEYFETFEVEA